MTPKLVTILFLVTKISADLLQTNTLIQRILKERTIDTILFLGNPSENESFLRSLDYPKLVCTPTWKSSSHAPKFDKNVLLLTIFPLNADHIIFEMMTRAIEVMRRRRFVVIHAGSLHDLQKYFDWFWENKFTRIFGTSDGKTYAFLPYADSKIQELDDGGLLPDALRNLNGHAIRTNIYLDPPRVFAYTDGKGSHKIGGSAAQLFFGFLQKHNATYTEVMVNNSNHFYLPALKRALLEDELDFSMSTYTFVPGLRLSYPIRFMRWAILVPYNGYIPANEYFTRSFQTSAWLAIVLTGVYIVAMGVLCDYVITRRFRVWETFSRFICIVLCVSTEHRIQNAYRFYVLVHVFSFILCNLYIVHLTSFLTVFIQSKQVDTLQDIIDQRLQIRLGIYERSYILRTVNLPPGLENLLIGLNAVDMENVVNMNHRVAAALTNERAEFLLTQQAQLRQPYFHKCKEFLTRIHLGFLLNEQSPFRDSLDRYVVEIQQSGLLAKWISDAVYQGREAGILKTLRDEDEPCKPLTMHHFSFAWNCYAAGLCLSLMVFLGEKFKHRWYRA